jgi:integrase
VSGCVLKYAGKRGVTWSVKYDDADGKQVRERLGSAADGWTKRKAQVALRARLVAVEKDGYRKPTPTTFATFARSWCDTYAETHDLRRTTRADYARMIEKHLVPHFGVMKLADITTADIESYVAAKKRQGFGPRTLGLHLTRIGQILDSARKQELVTVNVARDCERPKVPKSRWTILSPVEIAATLRAFDRLIVEAETEEERAWRETCKAMFVVFVYCGLRRGELLGLRWDAVELAHPDGPRLHVRQAWVRGAMGAPKTDEGARTIPLAPAVSEALWEHRRTSRYVGDDDLVFPHPLKGSPISGGYFGSRVRLALDRAGVEKHVREYHDLRHSAITNWAAAGIQPMAMKKMAGHANFATTQQYIDLAEVIFGDEVSKLSDWYAGSSTKKQYEVDAGESGSRSTTAIVGAVD